MLEHLVGHTLRTNEFRHIETRKKVQAKVYCCEFTGYFYLTKLVSFFVCYLSHGLGPNGNPFRPGRTAANESASSCNKNA